MKKFLLLLLVAVSCLPARAYYIHRDGIYYNCLDTERRTLEVISSRRISGTPYEGDIVIPAAILDEGKKWTVTRIGDDSFYNCNSLTSVSIPNSVTTIGMNAFRDCGSLTSANIGNSVTTIGGDAFYACYSLASVTIPNSVTTIGGGAFSGCSSLASVTIPNSVTTIGHCAFRDCSSLASVTIPNSVTTIEDEAFSSCSSLVSVDIPNSVTTIKSGAFSSCNKLETIGVDSQNETFTSFDGVLYNKELTTIIQAPGAKVSVNIPNSVTTIYYSAFRGCSSLASVDIPNSVTTIDGNAFRDCSSLASVDIPNSVTTIGYCAFSGCSSLASVNIGNSVTRIDDQAFCGCSSLASVDIPNSVTTIDRDAFRGCSALSSITCSAATPPSASASTFDDNTLINAKLYVPEESLSVYNSVDPWRNFFNIEATGIQDVAAENGLKAWSDNGILHMEGGNAPHLVYDLEGKELHRTTESTISGLAPGIYLVKVGNKTFKVAI